MLKRFTNYIKEQNLFSEKDKILLAVSGGIDSMLMAYLFKQSNYKVAIAHCNFQLRGEDSNGDEQFVKETARQYGFMVFTKKFDTVAYADTQKISIQMAARELRFQWFNQILQQHHYQYVATAHHLDDQIETFFINLFRGSGLKGLRSIEPKNQHIVRPLLFATRTEIELYAKQHEVKYREDYTNATEKYLRNKIRHSLLSMVKEIAPNYQSVFSDTFERLSKSNLLLEQVVTSRNHQISFQKEDTFCIDKKQLADTDFPELYLHQLLTDKNFGWDVVYDICKHLQGHSGKQFFSATHRLIIDRDLLLVSPKKEDDSQAVFYIDEECCAITIPFAAHFRNFDKSTDFCFSTDAHIAHFDYDLLKFPLTLRRWKKGDKFVPLGLKGKKKVSDFFIDHKFSLIQKEETWVLTNNDGKIIWIVGHRLDNRFKITNKTHKIYECRVED